MAGDDVADEIAGRGCGGGAAALGGLDGHKASRCKPRGREATSQFTNYKTNVCELVRAPGVEPGSMASEATTLSIVLHSQRQVVHQWVRPALRQAKRAAGTRSSSARRASRKTPRRPPPGPGANGPVEHRVPPVNAGRLQDAKDRGPTARVKAARLRPEGLRLRWVLATARPNEPWIRLRPPASPSATPATRGTSPTRSAARRG